MKFFIFVLLCPYTLPGAATAAYLFSISSNTSYSVEKIKIEYVLKPKHGKV